MFYLEIFMRFWFVSNLILIVSLVFIFVFDIDYFIQRFISVCLFSMAVSLGFNLYHQYTEINLSDYFSYNTYKENSYKYSDELKNNIEFKNNLKSKFDAFESDKEIMGYELLKAKWISFGLLEMLRDQEVEKRNQDNLEESKRILEESKRIKESF
jgi:hypothetical protein